MKTFIFFLVLFVPLAAFAGQAPLSPGYYVCEAMEGNTSYFSDIFLGPGDADAVSKAFAQMLAAKYSYTGRVSCPLAFKTDATLKSLRDQHKPYAAQRAQQGRKIVETGWTYSGAPSLSTGPLPVEPSGNELRPASGVYCYEATASNMVYYTKTKPYAANLDPNSFNVGFSDFIAKTYGERTSSQCFAANEIPNRNQFEAARQSTIDELQRAGKTLKFVEVDWTPTGRVLASGIPPASVGVPSAPKPDAQSAYEKALEAQRPRSNTGPQAGQSAATKDASPASGPLYSYCWVFGFPKRPGSQQHYYLTPLFANEPSSQPASAFQISVRGAHPDDSVQSAFCTPPKPMSAAEAERQRDLEGKRKNPAYVILEVNWKPGT